MTSITPPEVSPVSRSRRRRAGAPAGAPGGGRDRYLDMLRALALVRVVAYHTFGWAWLSLVFPSMGVMFALAGSLMARSLGSRPALTVVRGRLRRLLPPLWLFAAVVVLAMMVHGWAPEEGSVAGWWARLLLWVVPLEHPPGSEWAEQATAILWYLTAYLWFVLLSPLLLRAFRLSRTGLVLAFLAGITALQVVTGGLDGAAGAALTDVLTYGACWVLGFAHRDGAVARMPGVLVAAVSAVCLAVGGWWAYTHAADAGTYDLNEIPLAQAWWSVGFVLLLLRFPLRVDGPARVRPLDGLVSLLNARAVTVYLWHEIALILSVPLIDLLWQVPAFEESLPLDSMWFQFGVAWVLIMVAIPLVGWVEDLAARRPARLFPWPARAARAGAPE